MFRISSPDFFLKAIFSFSVVMMSVIQLAGVSEATNGYFPHGYGTINNGLGGAGVAFPQDTFAPATNPAGNAFLGNRYDVDVAFFNPNREYTVTGTSTGFNLTQGTFGSDSRWFVIPGIGANWMLNDENAIGLSIYGHGGMNTDYPTSTFLGSSPTGVDLSQLFIVPTFARKFLSKQAIGISPVFAYQKFEAKGLEAFSGFSNDPAHLTNNGHSNSYGYGAKIGYTGTVVSGLNLGASYQTRTKMSKFSDYAGLFAEQGSFDIPSTWTLGLSYKAVPSLTFLFDVQQINYSEVKSINNPFLPNLMTSKLGKDDGTGFGWQDTTVYKLGAQWQSSEDWTWRAGYSICKQPIPGSEVLFNIIAPGVPEQHATVGFTKSFSNHQDLNFALMRAFSKSVRGLNPLDPSGQQNIELKMDEWEADFSYSWNLPG
jgi:long-chain fatty acid transport protein